MTGRTRIGVAVLMVALMTSVVGLQALRERLPARTLAAGVTGNLLYVRSPEVMKRASLSYRGLVADLYWIRTLQHFGRTRRAAADRKQYDLLYPLLDFTTSLDPKFTIAYRFGSIFLAEPPPGGPGRPDEAVTLLKKGLSVEPNRWEYAQDIGFVYYRAGDYSHAADWFHQAAAVPGAPSWLAPLEAVTRTRGGDRETARTLWTALLNGAGAEQEWMRKEAVRRLSQLTALDEIDGLTKVIKVFQSQTGSLPDTWLDLLNRGYLRALPVDPAGHPYQLNPYWGIVTVDPASPLSPLPVGDDQVP